MEDHKTAAGARTDDPSSSNTLIVGLVGAVLVFVICVLLQVVYYRTFEHERRAKIINQQPEELRRLQVEQAEQLHGYRWVDKEAGVVAIPIDRAMELVVDDYDR